jgi:methylphosphotriester-DNA--protein-cysteine methyltransferase
MKRKIRYTILILLAAAVFSLSLHLPRAARAEYYGDTRTKRFHTEDCPEKKAIKPRNRQIFNSEEEAGSRGFYPCTLCIAPVGMENSNIQGHVMHSLPVVRTTYYVGDKQNKIYHYQWCAAAKALPQAEVIRFPNVEAAVKAGYERCPECRPSLPVVKNQVPPEEDKTTQPTPETKKKQPVEKPKSKPAQPQEIEDVMPGASM